MGIISLLIFCTVTFYIKAERSRLKLIENVAGSHKMDAFTTEVHGGVPIHKTGSI